MSVELIANLGAEEPDYRPGKRTPAAVATACALWASLFGANARLAGAAASPHPTPAFDWLPDRNAGVAWLPTAAALETGGPSCGEAWLAPAPAIVRRVHDKAFALGHTPAPLGDWIEAFDAQAFAPGAREESLRRMQQCVDGWPAWARAAFCLKPRFGSSGRGRVGGRDGVVDSSELRASFERLRRSGGALLEPWLERVEDLSAGFYIPEGSGWVEILGTLRAINSPAGIPLGHRGEFDSRGRVFSGSDHDDDVRACAAEAVAAARGHGFHGPCGTDAFSYREPQGALHLRPIVEFNARFTMGIVALGCIRRVRQQLVDALAVEPGERVAVAVVYNASRASAAELNASAAGLGFASAIPLALPAGDTSAPLLLGAREPSAIDAALAALAR